MNNRCVEKRPNVSHLCPLLTKSPNGESRFETPLPAAVQPGKHITPNTALVSTPIFTCSASAGQCLLRVVVVIVIVVLVLVGKKFKSP